MNIIEKIKENAKKANKRIVLAEGEEERNLKAADIIIENGYAAITLLGNKANIEAKAAEWGLKNIAKADIIDPLNNPKKDFYANMLYEIRKNKGMTMEEALKKVEDPLYLATLLIKNKDVDGEVTGAQHATGDVLRPAFQIVKTLPGISVVSGAFIMCFQDKKWGDDGVMVFADCAADPNTDENKLAQIAVVTAQTARTIAGIEPRVAMLSFSTKGSAKHELVDKVVNATRIAKEMDPNLVIDGELQADAAIIPSVGAQKAPGSPVAGKANVLVFPSLETGNIAYKLVQRFAGADAVGPVMQGMAAPINDLSRGCSVEDIVSLVAITACQAAGTDIPNFPVSTVEGHSGKLIFGKLGGVDILAMKGRFHFYEGYSMKEVTFPVRVMYELGVKTLFVSNAAGGMNPKFKIGDLMVITDHINFFPEHPLRGKNLPTGPRFPDMHEPYDPMLIKLADDIARREGISVKHGVYVGVQGPTFETPAEYRMYRILGGDAVGMSTVPEVIVAHHCGIRTFGVSVITDLGGFDTPVEVSHEEVQEAANKAQPFMTKIMKEMIIWAQKFEYERKASFNTNHPTEGWK